MATIGEERSVPPVFVPCRHLPDDTDNQYTVRELCAAAEKTAGYNSIIGAQRIGGLWRIYAKKMNNRTDLLLKGIEIRNTTVNPFDKNPYIVKTLNGETEVKTTKLIVGNLPLSYSNDDIETKLLQLGCKPHSKLLMERDRDERGGLTRWLTGRRFVYVEIPDRPLPDKIPIGPATATLYHREQKLTNENTVCSRCFTKGHRATYCTNDIVCRACNQPGHKRGHPSCEVPVSDTSDHRAHFKRPTAPQEDTTAPETTTDAASTSSNTTTSTAPPPSPRPTPKRGRDPTTQSRLNFQQRSQSREKRPRSSPPTHRDTHKTARLVNSPERRDDCPTTHGPDKETSAS